MKKNWYYRMFLSYAPIFFVVISSLIFVFFTTLNSSSKNKYIETNKSIIQQMMQYTDANLQLIERNVVSEIFSDKTLQTFFSDDQITVYDYYVIQQKLRDISSSFPFVNSIYMYNDANRKILSGTGVFSLDSFGDKTFFKSAYQEAAPGGWTNQRDYSQSAFDNKQKVVSLVKYYPYASDKQGAIVLNVYVSSIIDFLNHLNPNNRGSIHLLDTNKQPFQTMAEPIETTPIYANSGYTGWYFYAESIDASEYSILSLLSNIWIVLGLIIIILALVWFTLITHINYRPIQTIMGKIDDYTTRKSDELGIRSPRNEFKFIESAIDLLLEKTVNYENLHKEDMLLRQRNLFQELLKGYQTLSDSEWKKQMASFGLPHDYERLGVVALEIDRYASFTEKYSPSDQYLLKYLLETAFRELAQQREMYIWHAWIHPRQMAVVFHLHNDHEPYQETLLQVCEDFRRWINNNLELTVSAGIGSETGSITNIGSSCRNASENVSFKAVFGINSIIDNRKKCTKTNGETYNWFQTMLEMTHYYRLDDELWVDKLTQIFTGLKQMLLSQADMVHFINNLTHQIQKEMGTLSPEIQMLWREEYLDQFDRIASRTETIDELHDQVWTIMTKLAKEIDHERMNRKKHTVAVQIKAYIDRNYADPGLSLNQVSDLYGVSPRTASNMFKEELGEKFIDYLLNVRFAHAKHMLLETEEPIQSIAEKVGYAHVISFHRAFKKLFDLPPGEFRTLNRFHRETID